MNIFRSTDGWIELKLTLIVIGWNDPYNYTIVNERNCCNFNVFIGPEEQIKTNMERLIFFWNPGHLIQSHWKIAIILDVFVANKTTPKYLFLNYEYWTGTPFIIINPTKFILAKAQ